MYLDDLNEIMLSNATLAMEEIKSTHLKKIYYLVTGRNAWHSTWVQHFYKKCISTEHNELKSDAEKRRGPGTVFYIEELPALCLETSKGCIVISEINTNAPLKNYDPRDFLKIRNQCNYIKVLSCPSEQTFNGSRLSVICESLNSRECWKQPLPNNSIFKLFLKDKEPIDFEDHSGNFMIWNSGTSGGKKNSLSWVARAGSISGEYIDYLANP